MNALTRMLMRCRDVLRKRDAEITVNTKPTLIDPAKPYSYDDIVALVGKTGQHLSIVVCSSIPAPNVKSGKIRHSFSVTPKEKVMLKQGDRISAYNTGNA